MFKYKKLLAATLVLGLTVPSITAHAESVKDLKVKQSKLDEKKKNISKNIANKNEKLEENQKSLNKTAEQLSKLNTKIDTADDKIDAVQTKIDNTTKEINALQKSIKELQAKIDERGEIIKKRVRAMQAGDGNVSYVDVILGSTSFSNFIDRATAVNTIVEADETMMKEQKEDQEKVQKQQDEVKVKLASQKEDKEELVELKASLKGQKVVKAKLIKRMEIKQAKLNKERKALKMHYSDVVKLSTKVQNKIKREQEKAAELARKIAAEQARQRAAEQARQQASQQAAQANGGSSSNASSNISSPAAPVKVSSGAWMKPANGRFTSGFAGRDIGAGGEFHYGIDIANSSGTPIVAAADGVVFRASPLSTYGNVVMITHNIGGKTYTSLYAHMSGFATSPGKAVKKGEIIGYMGSTGRSTGPHVHFEIHNGSWVNQATGAVNPLQFISL